MVLRVPSPAPSKEAASIEGGSFEGGNLEDGGTCEGGGLEGAAASKGDDRTAKLGAPGFALGVPGGGIINISGPPKPRFSKSLD